VDITIYLPDDLGTWAKERELNLSRMLRGAVEAERHRRQAIGAALAEADTIDLDAEDDDGTGYTARIHGTLIAAQGGSTYPGVYVYLGKDEQVYVYDETSGKLHRNIEPDDLRELADEATYVQAMHAIGQVPVIDVGLPEAGTADADGQAPREADIGTDHVPFKSAREGLPPRPAGGRRPRHVRHIDPAKVIRRPGQHPAP